jgi:hypothetical protein
MEVLGMPQALVWTQKQDDRIRRRRSEGATWMQIGVEMGMSRNTIIERGRRLGAKAGQVSREPPPKREEEPVSEDPNRLPLRAGHPLTWGVISDDPWPGYESSFVERPTPRTGSESGAVLEYRMKSIEWWHALNAREPSFDTEFLFPEAGAEATDIEAES